MRSSLSYSSTQLLSVTLCLTLLPILAESSSRPQNALVDRTCQKTPFPSFCASALRSNLRSATAQSPQVLGLILLGQVDKKARSAIHSINALISGTRDPKAKEALSSCHDKYWTMVIGTVPASKESLTKGDYKFAQQYMTDAANGASICEVGLKGSGMGSWLSGENDFEHKAASVVAAIAQSLQ